MVRIHVSITKQFLQAVDGAARSVGMSRSTYIRMALLEKMGMNNMFDLTPVERIKAEQQENEEFFKKLMHDKYGYTE